MARKAAYAHLPLTSYPAASPGPSRKATVRPQACSPRPLRRFCSLLPLQGIFFPQKPAWLTHPLTCSRSLLK